MYKLALVALFFLGSFQIQAQVNINIELVAHVPLDDEASDIWGYVDDSGTEYAVIGTHKDTRIFSLEDPSEPTLRSTITGTFSIWRDIKSYGDYLYVIADQGNDGLLIIDMSNAPNEITHEFIKLTTPGTNISRCHNIYVDEENALLFTAGCNTLGGILAFDLKEDSGKPNFLSIVSSNYSHDVFAQNGYVYSSEINNGQLGIYDINDINNPSLLGSVKTTNRFTHNAWADKNDNYVYTTDEVRNGTLDAYNIEDKSNPILVDVFVPSAILGKGRTPHNTHFINDFLVTSWYSYGVVITDVSKSNKIIETGRFDTQMGFGDGCWGTYPYLPSGLILASDINNGLFILNPTYERAAYIFGTVKNSKTGQPIINASVKILSSNLNSEFSNQKGEYTAGQIEQGNFDIIFDHPEYDPETFNINLSKNEPVELNVNLDLSTVYNLNFKVVDALDGEIENANIQLKNNESEYNLITDNGGNADTMIISGTYDIVLGKWGYKYTALKNVKLQDVKQYTFQLNPGYEDDFIFDYKWTTKSPNIRSEWVRVNPIGTSYQGQDSNPGEDLDGDFGDKCYVTGNGSGGAGQFDVDGGESKLISPKLSLSDHPNAKLIFYPWFFNDGGSGTEPNDTFKVYVSNGIDTNLITQIHENTNGWGQQLSFLLADHITLNESVQIIFSASDDADGHLVEAAIDGFKVVIETSSSIDEGESTGNNWEVLLNPVIESIYLKSNINATNVKIELFNVEGRLISNNTYSQIIANEVILYPAPSQSGFYLLNINSGQNFSQTLKIIVSH